MALNMQSLGRALARQTAGVRAAQAVIGQRISAPRMAESVLSRKISERLALETQRYGGSLLKKGIIGMARRAGAPPEMIRELQNMDARTLELMHEQGFFDFETFFTYEAHGITEEKGYLNLTQANTDEIQKLIDAYRRFTA